MDCAPFVYLMLHKPAGLLSATEDRRQKTVLDLLPEHLPPGLFPVGRLDKDTEGSCSSLMTVPSATPALPKNHVDKVYYAKVEGRLDRTDAEALAAGWCWGRAALSARGAGAAGGRLPVSCHPAGGKYHQVKRMLAARGSRWSI